MQLRGIVMTAELEEDPPGSGAIEMVLRVQGVGPGQPRRIVIPLELLLQDPTLEPESVSGHGFQAEVVESAGRRWVVTEIAFAEGRVLRPPTE